LKTHTLFGPINSRRFGISLGIDLSPNIKQCNFDCLYCELRERAKQIGEQRETVPMEDILEDIEEGLKKYSDIDVLTFTANGEPTLYPNLYEMIKRVEPLKEKYGVKTLILSNGGNSWIPEVKKALLEFDKVKLSLDCATEECFLKIDRPLKGITIEDVREGILQFSEVYRGDFYLEVLFVGGINTKESEVYELNSFFRKLERVTRIDIGTVERPPTYQVEPILYDELFSISTYFDSDLPVMIIRHQDESKGSLNLSKSELLRTLSLRPLTLYDVASIFDEETQENFNTLLTEGLLENHFVGDIDFYRPIKGVEK
jgi:wyosine [tRNA(Phe)-imidazoG37] synthetase (radical SAM superfamily)